MNNYEIKIKAWSSNDTLYASMGKWKGKDVLVSFTIPSGCHSQAFQFPCPIEGHQLEVMHHYGDKGEHYCPTGFLFCPICGGYADEPEPFSCNKWGVSNDIT